MFYKIFAGFLFFSLLVKKGNSLDLPRGVRNNNPLNIKYNSANDWRGQTGADGDGFAVFDTPENGIRAAARILGNYGASGINTVDDIIARWTSGDSPEIQSAYVSHIVGELGLSADYPIDSGLYPSLLAVMIKHENGQQPYSESQIKNGVMAA